MFFSYTDKKVKFQHVFYRVEAMLEPGISMGWLLTITLNIFINLNLYIYAYQESLVQSQDVHCKYKSKSTCHSADGPMNGGSQLPLGDGPRVA